MQFSKETSEVYVPDGASVETAIARTTHMGISAHQDDLEIMALDGILACFGQSDKWYLGVVATNGAGSPRDGLYGSYSDEQMRAVRRIMVEQLQRPGAARRDRNRLDIEARHGRGGERRVVHQIAII